MAGLGIQAPNKTRPRQQAYLRAAKKLEEVGFVVREEVPVVVLTIDPRRERPVYRSGRFWRRKDPRRRQTVNRIFIWATPLGVGIRKAYEKELSRGDPIRWKTEKVELARGYERTHWANPSTHRESVEALRDGYSLPGAESEAGFREHYPPEVRSPDEQRRWLVAVGAARRWKPKLGSEKLWELALEEYRSPKAPRRFRDAAEKALRKRPKGGLGRALIQYSSLIDPFRPLVVESSDGDDGAPHQA